MLFACTDGHTEGRGTEWFGQERLELHGRPAVDLPGAIVEGIVGFSAGTTCDDMAVRLAVPPRMPA